MIFSPASFRNQSCPPPPPDRLSLIAVMTQGHTLYRWCLLGVAHLALGRPQTEPVGLQWSPASSCLQEPAHPTLPRLLIIYLLIYLLSFVLGTHPWLCARGLVLEGLGATLSSLAPPRSPGEGRASVSSVGRLTHRLLKFGPCSPNRCFSWCTFPLFPS